jgi:hypothetical protein
LFSFHFTRFSVIAVSFSFPFSLVSLSCFFSLCFSVVRKHAPLFDKTVKRIRDGFEKLPTRGTFSRAPKGLVAEWYPMDHNDVEAIRRQGYFHETIGQITKFSYQDFRTENYEKLAAINTGNMTLSSFGETKLNASGSTIISPQKAGRRGVQGAHISRYDTSFCSFLPSFFPFFLTFFPQSFTLFRMYKSSEGRIENTPEDNFSAYRKWHPDLIPTNNTNPQNNSILDDRDMNSTIASITSSHRKKQENRLQQAQQRSQPPSPSSFQQQQSQQFQQYYTLPPQNQPQSSQQVTQQQQQQQSSLQQLQQHYPPHQRPQQLQQQLPSHQQQQGQSPPQQQVYSLNSQRLSPNSANAMQFFPQYTSNPGSRRPSFASQITLDTAIADNNDALESTRSTRSGRDSISFALPPKVPSPPSSTRSIYSETDKERERGKQQPSQQQQQQQQQAPQRRNSTKLQELFATVNDVSSVASQSQQQQAPSYAGGSTPPKPPSSLKKSPKNNTPPSSNNVNKGDGGGGGSGGNVNEYSSFYFEEDTDLIQKSLQLIQEVSVNQNRRNAGGSSSSPSGTTNKSYQHYADRKQQRQQLQQVRSEIDSSNLTRQSSSSPLYSPTTPGSLQYSQQQASPHHQHHHGYGHGHGHHPGESDNISYVSSNASPDFHHMKANSIGTRDIPPPPTEISINPSNRSPPSPKQGILKVPKSSPSPYFASTPSSTGTGGGHYHIDNSYSGDGYIATEYMLQQQLQGIKVENRASSPVVTVDERESISSSVDKEKEKRKALSPSPGIAIVEQQSPTIRVNENDGGKRRVNVDQQEQQPLRTSSHDSQSSKGTGAGSAGGGMTSYMHWLQSQHNISYDEQQSQEPNLINLAAASSSSKSSASTPHPPFTSLQPEYHQSKVSSCLFYVVVFVSYVSIFFLSVSPNSRFSLV